MFKLSQAAKAGLDAATSRLNASTDAEKADAEISVEVRLSLLTVTRWI